MFKKKSLKRNTDDTDATDYTDGLTAFAKKKVNLRFTRIKSVNTHFTCAEGLEVSELKKIF